jgi:hypothetical protein
VGPQFADGGTASRYRRQARMYSIKTCGQPKTGDPPGWFWARCQQILALKIYDVTNHFIRPWTWTDNLGRWRALVNAVMNLRDLESAGNFVTSWGPVSF